MTLIADESVDYGIIDALRNNGYEIFAIEDINKGATDEDVLNFFPGEKFFVID